MLYIDLHLVHEVTSPQGFDVLRARQIGVQRPDKTLATLEKIFDRVMADKHNRTTTFVAVGGGVVGDITGFAAACYQRGVNFVQVPTTLLAQADSCIGGKSSLNLKKWKNIIGNFYPPQQLFVQERFLETLDETDIRSGMGEIIKVHLLSGSESSRFLQERLSSYSVGSNILSELVINSLSLKNKILEIDPLDKGLRLACQCKIKKGTVKIRQY